MSYMPPTDAMFLWAESREHPMHVGGLQLFIPPDDLGPDFVTDMVDSWREIEYVNPMYRKRPAEPVGTPALEDFVLPQTADIVRAARTLAAW